MFQLGRAHGKLEKGSAALTGLVKTLRLEGAPTILETYLPKMNEKFSRPAKTAMAPM
jgi:hypothetical protein